MKKKHYGRMVALTAIVGTAAAGISYFLRYKSFHKELDEDFHDFEDDFDDDLKNFEDGTGDGNPPARNYVPLNKDWQTAKSAEEASDESQNAADSAAKTAGDGGGEGTDGQETSLSQVSSEEENPDRGSDEPSAEPAPNGSDSSHPETASTTIVEDTAP